MYAVMQAGGHQYKVSQGDVIKVDFHEGNVGDSLTFDKVLMLGGDKITVGAPLVAGASVEAVIRKQTKNPKIIVFKFKRRKGYRFRRGHKQLITEIEVKSIKH